MGHFYGMTGLGTAGLGLGCNGVLGHEQGWEKPWRDWLGMVRIGNALTCVSRECFLPNLRFGKATVHNVFTSDEWGEKKKKKGAINVAFQ